MAIISIGTENTINNQLKTHQFGACTDQVGIGPDGIFAVNGRSYDCTLVVAFVVLMVKWLFLAFLYRERIFVKVQDK